MADQRRRKDRRAAAAGDQEAAGRAARDAVRAGEGAELVQVGLQLRADMLARVDQLAAARGVRRVALVREGLGLVLGDDQAADHQVYLRHRRALREALPQLKLTREEACLVMDALNGVYLHHDGGLGHSPVASVGAITMEVHDHCRLNAAGEKWGVDGADLVSRLGRMTPLQALALADAARTFWELTELDTYTALRVVGLMPS